MDKWINKKTKADIKRNFYNGTHYIVDRENNEVVLNSDFFMQLQTKTLWGSRGYKKIGGSSIGDVLKVNSYTTQFVAWCRMAWIGIPVLDTKYVDAGNAIEPKVIEAIEKASGKKVETYDPFEYNFDFFAGIDEVMGGLPDGYIKDDKHIIEIKTTGAKNFKKWNETGVPAHYLKQAQLYSYLIGADKYSLVATFLEEQDYENPYEYDVSKRQIRKWTFDLDKEVVEQDIKTVKNWYKQYTNQKQSPSFDLSKSCDRELIEWLECSNKEECEKYLIEKGIID